MSLENQSPSLQRRDATYEYYMVQVPSTIAVAVNQSKGNELGNYLQALTNQAASNGWEFYRVDTMTAAVTAGCLASLLGGGTSYTQYSIVTFRKLRN